MSMVNLDGFTLNGTDYNILDRLAQNRIDNIVANANNTEGNSELVDIRVGWDGTVYTSAGAAVRTQILNERTAREEAINQLSNDMVEQVGYNFYSDNVEGLDTVYPFVKIDISSNVGSELHFKILNYNGSDTNRTKLYLVGVDENGTITELTTNLKIGVDYSYITTAEYKYFRIVARLNTIENISMFIVCTKLDNKHCLTTRMYYCEENLKNVDNVLKTMVAEGIYSGWIDNATWSYLDIPISVLNKDILYLKPLACNVDSSLLDKLYYVGVDSEGSFTELATYVKVGTEYIVKITKDFVSLRLVAKTNEIVKSGFLSTIVRVNDSRKHYNTFSILGDSYSTFSGFTQPTENTQWYPTDDNTTQGYESGNDVNNVEETWWYLFANEYKAVLQINNSYSGATVCYDGYGNGNTDAKEKSFINRANNVGKPELLFVFGLTNDLWASSSLGDYKNSNWVESDLSFVRPALSYLLNYLKQHNVGSKIVFILNDELSGEILESAINICNYYSVDYLQLNNISKTHGHPNKEGMISIKNQLIDFMKRI